MAFFNSRKRLSPPTVATVEEVPPTPATPAPSQPTQFSPAPLGATLRLAPTPEPVLRLAAAPSPEPETQETRAEDLRGLPLGTILYRQGLVQQDELEEALVAGMESGERLGEVLIRLGLVGQDDIARGLAAQQGLSFSTEEELDVDGEVAALLPSDEARELGVVAVRAEGDGVLVATPDPSAAQREELELRLRRPVAEVVVSKGVFDGLLLNIDQLTRPTEDEITVQEPPIDEAPEHHHEPEEEQMDQVWTDTHVEETEPEAWPVQTPPEEGWSEPVVEAVADIHAQPEESSSEPVAEAVAEHAEASELDAQHHASVGRIHDLLARIDEGASTFADLRARLGGLSENLRTAEESVAERDRHLAELTDAHEADERRIEELVGQLQAREEELRGVGGRLEELNGRLVSAEERLDDRERRLDELFSQVERRDNALAAFEAKLDGIAARFAADPSA